MTGWTWVEPFAGAAAETWRPVVDGPAYEVSSLGRVRSVATGRVLRARPCKGRGGHLQVQLGRAGGNRYVHALVLEAFVGPRPDGAVARHLDGDPTNNRPGNLAWGTVQENQADTVRHGRTTRGEKNPRARLTAEDVAAIREARTRGESLKALAARYGVRESCISRAASGKRWGHVT